MPINELSLISLPIRLFRDDQIVASATAFLMEQDGRWFIVTAWHNLTGQHRWTLKSISKAGSRPNKIVCSTHLVTISSTGAATVDHTHSNWTQELFEGDMPLWRVHPDNSVGCDVAVLECENFHIEHDNARPLQASPLSNDKEEMALDVGGSLFVIGFPFGHEPFPTWKRATIASEPSLMDSGTIPFLSVDTATRQGLSGSPVYTYETSSYRTKSGGTILSRGPHHRFVGIYTGRRPVSDGDDAQIGIVWSRKLISEVLANGIPDVPECERKAQEFPKWKYPDLKPSEL